MKFATIEVSGALRAVAVCADGQFVDPHAVDTEIPVSLKQLLGMGADGLDRAAAAVKQAQSDGSFVTGKLLAPIPDPQKVLCIGLNYRDHAIESGMAIPEEPVCFSKFSSAVIGPEETVELPPASQQVDYEAELVAVIGRAGRDISKENAFAHVAGYTVGNDVSARDWQIGRPGGQWLLGKTPDTFAPIGPYLITADEIADPHNLQIALRLNGETVQDSRTTEFIFGIDEVIAHVSQLVTLLPGDLIFTGTPPGVGMARKPPLFLKPGDVMEVEIESVGVLKNPVSAR